MHKFAEKIMECVKSKVEARGIDNVSYEEAKELGEWVDIAKDIVCYDKDMRIIEAMDEEEKYEEMEHRMGYRGRDSRGRFVHRPGRGRSAGYTPFIVWGIPVEEAETLAVVVLEILVETILCLVVLAILEGREKILEDLDMAKAMMDTVMPDAIIPRVEMNSLRSACRNPYQRYLTIWKTL